MYTDNAELCLCVDHKDSVGQVVFFLFFLEFLHIVSHKTQLEKIKNNI